jgi:hypothetical protein
MRGVYRTHVLTSPRDRRIAVNEILVQAAEQTWWSVPRRVGWIRVAAQEFFGVVGMVDLRRSNSIRPRQPAGVGDFGTPSLLRKQLVVGSAGEEQRIGVGGAARNPFRAVMYLGVIPGLKAIRAGAAAVT